MSVVAGTPYGWLFTSLLTAVLNACKFFLSYRLGCAVGDRSLGLLMVVGLLLINFTAMQVITFTHTNLVETIMLLVIYWVHRSTVVSQFSWLLMGLMCGLAFHVHPTAFLVGFFVFSLWLSKPHKILNGAWFLLGLMVAFAPLIMYALYPNQDLVPGIEKYADQHFTRFNLSELLKLFTALVYVGPYSQLLPVFGQVTAMVLAVIQCLMVLLGLASSLILWRSAGPKLCKLIFQLWLFYLLSSIGLLLIRANTPWYMVYGVSLTLMLITASGWYLLCKARGLNKLPSLFCLWAMLVFVAFHGRLITDLNHEEVRVTSGSSYDVKSLNTDLSPTSYEISAHRAHQHGQYTCDHQPTALHGPYSHLIYSHSGVEHLSHCGGHGLVYGPDPAAFNVLGVPRSFQKMIHVEPIHQIGSTIFYQPIDISEAQTSLTEAFLHDYERTHTFKSDPDFQPKTTRLTGGKHLIVTNLLGFKMRSEITQVMLNGQVIDPSVTNTHSSLFVCDSPKCVPEHNQWTVSYRESIEGMTNVVSF